jgi:hypothetical protein
MYYWILHISRIPLVYYLLFFELQIKRYELYKICINSNLNRIRSEADMWRILIERYWFGWIAVLVR